VENTQFEINPELLVALIAQFIDVPPEQILLSHTAGETSQVKAIVRTDLQTANKIDKKLKRLKDKRPEGKEEQSQPEQSEA
jgi:hypothetical protein